jgi:hypothetical protein
VTPEVLQAAWPHTALSSVVPSGFGVAHDQGHRPTCLALAFTHSHESARSDGNCLSSEYLFWAARQRDGLSPDADYTTLPATQIALRDIGQPVATQWPYESTRTIDATYAPPSNISALYRRQSRVVTSALRSIGEELTKGRAPILILRVVEPDFYAPPNGIIPEPLATHTVSTWLHAITAVGMATEKSGNQSVVVRNSWGPDWGVQGYGLVPEAYLSAHMQTVITLE